MISILLLLALASGAYLARSVLGTWVNHLSVYTLIWVTSLELNSFRLISYRPISGEAWFFIIVAWLGLYLGSWIGTGAHVNEGAPTGAFIPNVQRLRWGIIALSLLSAVSVVAQVKGLEGRFGANLATVMAKSAGEIYKGSVEGQLGGIAYINILCLPACALAGIYCARLGRISLMVLVPVLPVIASAILSMQRGNIFIAGIMFVVAFALTPRERKLVLRKVPLFSTVGLLLIAFLAITATRSAVSHAYPQESPTLAAIDEHVPLVGSLYFYASSTPVGFSEFLYRPRDVGEYFGRFTFAPINRVLSHWDLVKRVPYYLDFYDTPAPTNTCTYLREVYSDFGPLGIFVFPLLLGWLMTYLWRSPRSLWKIFLLVQFYIVIIFSIILNSMMLGQWDISLAALLLLAPWLNAKTKALQLPTAANAALE